MKVSKPSPAQLFNSSINLKSKITHYDLVDFRTGRGILRPARLVMTIDKETRMVIDQQFYTIKTLRKGRVVLLKALPKTVGFRERLKKRH